MKRSHMNTRSRNSAYHSIEGGRNVRLNGEASREFLLAGDVGATKTLLALFPFTSAIGPIAEQTYNNCSYSSLEEIIKVFLHPHDLAPGRACFAVAGPVSGARARMTNLPWEIDNRKLIRMFGFKEVILLNDLEATALSIPVLSTSDLLTLSRGQEVEHGTIAVIAVGTGLGEAYLTWNGKKWVVHPSEGGHADFAPNSPLQDELLTFLRREYGHVSVERVASGRGIAEIYRFLRDERGLEEPLWLAERLGTARDPTPIIVSAALDQACPLCVETMQVFVSILGAEAGNLVLKVLARGGIYLGGGLIPHILPFLRKDRFLVAAHGKGRFLGLLKEVPVRLILNPRAALLGAARRGLGHA